MNTVIIRNTKFVVLSLILFLLTSNSSAQIGNSFDVGVSFGAISIQSDYGERGNINSGLTGNIGYTTSIVLYKNFYDREVYWNTRSEWIQEHLKLKAEVRFFKTNLKHFGSYSEGDSDAAVLLRAMHGSSSVINFGGGIEYHFISLTDFLSDNQNQIFSPYVSVGGMFGLSKATVSSDLGNIEGNPSLLITAYQDNAIYTEREQVVSLVFGVGTRIKMSRNTDLILDTRWQDYFSDRVDGLAPTLDANKYSDWTYAMSVGIVTYL